MIPQEVEVDMLARTSTGTVFTVNDSGFFWMRLRSALLAPFFEFMLSELRLSFGLAVLHCITGIALERDVDGFRRFERGRFQETGADCVRLWPVETIVARY